MRIEVNGIVKKWHYAKIDGKQVRVIDEIQPLGISLVYDIGDAVSSCVRHGEWGFPITTNGKHESELYLNL